MALIKCNECGQIVSDKAEACPHCGCPVEKPMACPECGQVVNVGDTYCLKCGCPLGQENNQPAYQYQETSQVDETWDDNGPSSNGKWLWISLAVLALLAIGGTTFWLNQRTSTVNATVEEDNTAVVEEIIEEAPVDSIEAVIDDVAAEATCDEYDEYNEYNENSHEDYGGQDEKQSKADKEKRARIARYESRIQEGINELNYMLKTGQMNPMNIIFLKQSLPNDINYVIRMYYDLGDYDKANQWTNELHYIESILSQLNV